MADRNRYITHDDAAMLIEAAPNVHWRTIIALARFAGLRCPSEVLSLLWADTYWSAGRMTTMAPKTKRYKGKGLRLVPIFGDLPP